MAEHAIRIGVWRITAERETERPRKENRTVASTRESIFGMPLFLSNRGSHRVPNLGKDVETLLDAYLLRRSNGISLL